MNSKHWLIYLVFYLVFNVWSIFKLEELKAPHNFNITDIFYIIMLISIVGLILKRKIINNAFWKVISWVSIIFFIHAWVIMPMVYLGNDTEWKSIGLIQLFAVPSLPLFIGLFFYVWRSPEIWGKTPNKAIKKDV